MKTKEDVNFKRLLLILLTIGFLSLCVLTKIFLEKSESKAIEKTELFLNTEIDQKDIASYRTFIKNNLQHQRPISKEEFLRQIKDAQIYLEFYPSGKTAEDLRKKIITELNIGFLLDKLTQRKLVVNVTAVRQYKEFTESELLFKDPQVGNFSALFLVPKDKKAHYPAVVGLHGHGGSKRSFRDKHFGRELAKAGFVVIMPSFRAMRCDKTEIVISEELYFNGFTLMGLRIYETFLIIEYLKERKFVGKIGIMGHSGGSDVAYLVSIINPDLEALVYDTYPVQLDIYCGKVNKERKCVGKIGIMGHSGGSDVAYLVSIISSDLEALVFDTYPVQLDIYCGKVHKEKKCVSKIDIMGHSGGSDVVYSVSIISPDLEALLYNMYPVQLDICFGKFHCETIPTLAYYGPQINNAATLKIPSLKFEYGYSNPNDVWEVIAFFKENLN